MHGENDGANPYNNNNDNHNFSNIPNMQQNPIAGYMPQHKLASFSSRISQSNNFADASRTSNDLADLEKNSSHVTQDDDVILPIPDWPVALREWGVCWELHVYGSATLFLLLTVFSLGIFFRFRARVRRFQIVLNILVLLTASGLFRGFFLLIDPYGYKDKMAGLMVGVMTQAVYPLLCACYGLTQALLIRVTNVDVGTSKLRSLSALLGCTLAYLFLVVVVETIVFYERHLKLLLLLDSGCFIVWALYLGITFICSGFRLTQYTSETKKARKELNAFSNQRRSASNNTALSAISGTSSTGAGVSTIKTDMTSVSNPPMHLEPTSNYASNMALSYPYTTNVLDTNIDQDGTTSYTSLDRLPSNSSNPHPHHNVNNARPNGGFRLYRPKMKISNRNYMTITIVTDDDDQSTSSTDVEKANPPNEMSQARAVRKVYRHKHKRQRGAGSKNRVQKDSGHKKGSDLVVDAKSDNEKYYYSDINDDYGYRDSDSSKYTPLPTDENDGEYRKNTKKGTTGPKRNKGKITTKNRKDIVAKAKTSELPLLDSCQISNAVNQRSAQEKSLTHASNQYVNKDASEPNRHANEEGGENYNNKNNTNNNNYDIITETLPNNNMQIRTAMKGILDDDDCNKDSSREIQGGSNSLCASGSGEKPISGLKIGADGNNEAHQLAAHSVSVRDNGYLADMENVALSGAASSFSSRQTTNPNHHVQKGYDVTHCVNDPDSSEQSDVSSCLESDDDDDDDEKGQSSPASGAASSLAFCDRFQCRLPAPVGLFRIRQSKMVHRAVHLTYFVTFLFLFACLMQLYTVFGVYGVLGTIRRPDPWPWLIFHSIFRLLECAIGFSVAAIAFIALNHRHQRAKRRLHQQQQQQQHQQLQQQPVLQDDQLSTISITGDCVV